MDFVVAKLLQCNIKEIGEKMSSMDNFFKVSDAFAGKRVFTLYRSALGCYREFQVDGFSLMGADFTTIPINNGVNISAYFKLRHRINLRNPQNPCIIYKKQENHYEYYPLELIRVLPAKYTRLGHEEISCERLLSRHFYNRQSYKNYINKYNDFTPKVLPHHIFTTKQERQAPKKRGYGKYHIEIYCIGLYNLDDISYKPSTPIDEVAMECVGFHVRPPTPYPFGIFLLFYYLYFII